MARGLIALLAGVFLSSCARCAPTERACCPSDVAAPVAVHATEVDRCVDGLPFQISFYTGGPVAQRRYTSDSPALASLSAAEREVVGEWLYSDIRFPPKALLLTSDHDFVFRVREGDRTRWSRGTWTLDGVVLTLVHVAVDDRPLCRAIRTIHFLSDLKVRGGTGYPLK